MPGIDVKSHAEISEENETNEETVNADDSDSDHQDEECVPCRSGIEYFTGPIPARRRMRSSIQTQSS